MMGGIRLSRPLIVSTIAIAIGGLFLLANLPALASAIFSLGGGDDEASQTLAKLVTEHDERLNEYRERFDGRSVFFKPPKRRPPIVRAAPTPEAPRPDPKPAEPTISPTYLGPSVIGIMGNEAWFLPPRAGEGPLRVRIGETKEGVTLIEITPPWSIKVGHKGGEYVVDIFERPPAEIWTPGTRGSAAARVPSLQDAAGDATLADADAARTVGRAEEEIDPPAVETDDVEESDDVEEPDDEGEEGEVDEDDPDEDDGEGEGEDDVEEDEGEGGEVEPDPEAAEDAPAVPERAS